MTSILKDEFFHSRLFSIRKSKSFFFEKSWNLSRVVHYRPFENRKCLCNQEKASIFWKGVKTSLKSVNSPKICKSPSRILQVSPMNRQKNSFEPNFSVCSISMCVSSTQHPKACSFHGLTLQIERRLHGQSPNQTKMIFLKRFWSLSHSHPGGAGFKHRLPPGRFSFL